MKPVSSTFRRERAGPGTAPHEPRGLFELLAGALLGTVVIARLLTPTDAAAIGETLWIAQLSLLAFILFALAAWRADGLRIELHWVDGSVLLLCLGHVSAALVVVATRGDKRAALNMLWEWCGVAATYFLMRWLTRAPGERRGLLLAVAAAAVPLAALGIWQHYGGLADSRNEYAKLKQQMQALAESGRPADPRAALEWDRAAYDLRVKFVQMGVPHEEGARMLWEARLASTEATGQFALANTLGGVLTCAAVVWLGVLVYSGRGLPRWLKLTGAVLTLAVFYCLLLTKSRTALVGLMIGVSAWMARARLWRQAGRRRLIWGLSFGIAAAVGLIAIAGATGGLDRRVVSESAKSLRYRFEYWHGTCQMLTASPRNWLVGVGPGNFRDNYLPFKLAQSSEEIADPHNLLLDVWSNGGLIAVVGLAGLCLAGLRPLRPAAQAADDAQANPSWRDGILCGAVLGHLAVLVPGGSDETIVLLLLGWLCVVTMCWPLFCGDLPRLMYGAAFVTLAVHLLGAGGIAMPGMLQLLLSMVVLGNDFRRPGMWSFSTAPRWPAAVIGLAGVGLYAGCWYTSLLPVYTARAAIAAGEGAWIEEGQFGKAEREFRRAAEADPWSSTPYERLAQLAFQAWQASAGGNNDEAFDRSVAWQGEAIARNPMNAGANQELGGILMAKFQRTEETRDALRAAEAFRRAVALYPNNAVVQSELAESLWKAGETAPARAAAQRAQELDALAEEAGHSDKRLPAAGRELMTQILKGQLP